MRYRCELGAGQSVYLENLSDQTLITANSSSLGQQQQSSSSFQTGRWTAPPEAFRMAIGVVVRLSTGQGKRFVHIQGSSLIVLNEAPSLNEAQALQMQQVASMPAHSMPAMQPLKMGDMQMERGTMSMQMGQMRLSMNPIAQPGNHETQTTQPEVAESTVGQQNFCSQCGHSIQPSDRFCAHCGHRLT